MSEYLKIGFALSAIILLGAGCAKGGDRAPAGQNTPVSEEPAATGPQDLSGEVAVEYKDGAFNPPTIRVLQGTKVTFVNKGTKPVWPASGVHPAHDICPGFDSLSSIAPGKTYSYTFTRSAQCPYHNHLAPSEKGTVEVHEE